MSGPGPGLLAAAIMAFPSQSVLGRVADCALALSQGFVEFEAGELLGSGGVTVMQFDGREGDRLRIALGPGAGVGVLELAKAFWGRRT